MREQLIEIHKMLGIELAENTTIDVMVNTIYSKIMGILSENKALAKENEILKSNTTTTLQQ